MNKPSDITEQSDREQDASTSRGHAIRFGLSGKLLMLTVVFVMIAEVLIYVPSVANFRMNWLRDRLAAAHTAALVLDAAPAGAVPESLARQLLESIGARSVAMKAGNQRRLLAATDMPVQTHHDVDVRNMSSLVAIRDAFDLLLTDDSRVMRLTGDAPAGGQFVEVVLDEKPLRAAMLKFSTNILLLSLVISAITASFVYLALNLLFVRPLRRITNSLIRFHASPQEEANVIAPSTRSDEIGFAEQELAAMQRDLVSLLKQKSHLAALGLAVSKINHDLRNLLASAQLISDRLSHIPDPRAKQFGPKLMQSLERAIHLCQSTLSYGRAQEAPPSRRAVEVASVVADVYDVLGLAEHPFIKWRNDVSRGLMVDADADHLFRVLLNLGRNAVQVLESHEGEGAIHEIHLRGWREGSVTHIEIADTGPGVPAKAKEHLFQAFQGAARPGGTGLGLAIADELVRAHGGEIVLIDHPQGAVFRFTIPDRPVELQVKRNERTRA